MEVLTLLLVLAALLAALYFSAIGLVVVIFVIGFSWPTLIGLCLGGWLWSSGHENIGMIAIVGGIVGNVVLLAKSDLGKGGGYDPMAGKTKISNKDGRIIGYRDKN